jgi:hypothetical protein
MPQRLANHENTYATIYMMDARGEITKTGLDAMGDTHSLNPQL